jgi:hypothetical protein
MDTRDTPPDEVAGLHPLRANAPAAVSITAARAAVTADFPESPIALRFFIFYSPFGIQFMLIKRIMGVGKNKSERAYQL